MGTPLAQASGGRKIRIAIWALAPILLLVSGCSGTASVKEAEAEVAAFHKNLDTGNYEAVWKDSSEEITKGESKDALVGMLTAIHTRLGNVKSTKQNGWKVNYNNGVSTTEVTMQTTFERGSLEENFLFRGTDDGLKLAGYRFNEK